MRRLNRPALRRGIPEVRREVNPVRIDENDAFSAKPLLHRRRRWEVAAAAEPALAVDHAVARERERVVGAGG